MRIHSFTVRHRNGWGTGTGLPPTHCAECGAVLDKMPAGSVTTGYGVESMGADVTSMAQQVGEGETPRRLKPGERIEMGRAVCFDCCGRADLASMRATGRAVLYLVRRGDDWYGPDGRRGLGWRVVNWPGTLDLAAGAVKRSRGGGGFGAQRTDTWFVVPGDPYLWHGVNRGDNDILRCRRTRQLVRK